jgi:chromosome transmission fidelity protein 1
METSSSTPSSSNNKQQTTTTPYVWQRSFPPYLIQHEFMTRLYQTLQDGHCGVFESPTGSGKTLSIISTVIPWIRTHWNRNETPTPVSVSSPSPLIQQHSSNPILLIQTPKQQQPPSSSSRTIPLPLSTPSPSWISDYQTSLVREKQQKIDELVLERHRQHKAFLAQGGWRASSSSSSNNKNNPSSSSSSTTTRSYKRTRSDSLDSSDSTNSQQLLLSLRDEHVQQLFASRRKVFYCSRTHSQLGQFLQEVKNSFSTTQPVSAIALGSRAHLCTNTKLKQQCKSVPIPFIISTA